MALTKLIVTLLIFSSFASQIVISDTASNHRLEPPVYVIKDEPQPNSNQQPRWNNQKLTPLQKQQQLGNLEPADDDDDGNKLAIQAQAYYPSLTSLDEPKLEPSHHNLNNYFEVIGNEANEQPQGYEQDEYYQPLRRNQYSSELAWYARSSSSTGSRNSAARRSTGTRTTSNTKTRGNKKSPPATSNRRRGAGHSNKTPQHVPEYSIVNPLGPSKSKGNTTNRAYPGSNKRKNLVCYYGTWAVYRPDAGKYPVENIDPFLCTHLIYGFTGLSYDSLIKPLDPWNDLEDNYGKGAMKRFTNLKRINPDLKTLVAIGGWNEGSIKYSKMASEPEARAKFVKSVVDFLAKYNFDGLDLDWEYPGARGGQSYDKQNFVRLLRELKEAFEPRGYLLTAAVSAGKWFIDPAYDIAQVSKYLDLINLMAYDYHGGWETKTGMNAPLFHSPKYDSRDESLLNVNWSVNYWLQHGAPAEKIMLGVGSYGRSFTLDKASVNGINAPASQKGQAGPYTREPGSLGYNEICESFQRQPRSWTIVRDPDYLAPYAYNDRQWVGYDDMESLALKTQYAKSMGLGGMMMWSIETDDFHGRCHQEKYPLLNTIKRVLNGGGGPTSPAGTNRPATTSTTRSPISTSSSTTSRRPVTPTKPGLEIEDEVPSSTSRRPAASTTRVPTRRPTTGGWQTSRRPTATTSTSTTTTTTTTTSTTTQRPPTGELQCGSDGMFADPNNCRKFIRCVGSATGRYITYKFDCAPGTAFNEERQYCDYIYNVPSCSTSGNTNNNLILARRQARKHLG